MYQKRGATLVELAFLAGLLALIAAVAAPSLAGARTRARVSRAKDGLRQLAVGLEAYRIDSGSYPQEGGIASPQGSAGRSALNRLTTPNVYLAGGIPDDPFGRRGESFGYLAVRPCRRDPEVFTPALERDRLTADSYALHSVAPDRARIDPRRFLMNARAGEEAEFMYDPTNGTTSGGDLWRLGGELGSRRTADAE